MFLVDPGCPFPADAAKSRGSLLQGVAVGLMLGFAVVCLQLPDAAAQVNKPEKPSATDGAIVQPGELRADPAPLAKPVMTPDQKRKMVIVTTMLIAGILTVLLILLLWIMWWSRRTHRLLREPLPATKRGDELWYLKAKSDLAATADSPTPDTPIDPPSK